MSVVDSKDSNSKNEELVTRKDIKDSPFVIVGIDGEFFGSMGKYRITEPRETEKEVEKELKEITWNRLVQVMLLLIETTKEEK